MKKNSLRARLTYTLLLSSPLLLSACQGVEQLFTDSPTNRYNGQESRGNTQHSTIVYQSGSQANARSTSTPTSSTTSAVTSSPTSSATTSTAQGATTQATKKAAGSGVPLEAPMVGQ
ncbi:Uncharacterised protein [Legionella lansingensis]|uniref:Lipoprotein n=1 Tax=Legionella lansingensis TaxID=45067 RepID=A0A0W0VSF8_9GAMM|nr:hypothetical protein [Legionella lansingensis]KTD22745.1 hypothetical protein Llan_1096 [Legionella lansingensis]SNV56801.1 Uncharacterised protein [Legionella lansingensis]